MNNDFFFMKEAIALSKKAFEKDEVPIGALIVAGTGEILAKSFNEKESTHNPLGHAELLCILSACQKKKNWRLSDATIYVTLEPCLMCLAALGQARIKRLVFGAYDLKGGALSLGYDFFKDPRLNHRFEVYGGILQNECGELLSDFFRKKRKASKEDT